MLLELATFAIGGCTGRGLRWATRHFPGRHEQHHDDRRPFPADEPRRDRALTLARSTGPPSWPTRQAGQPCPRSIFPGAFVIKPTAQEGRFEVITEGRPAWYHLGTMFPGMNSSCGRAVGAAVDRVSSAGERFALPHSDNSPPRSDDLPLKRRYPFRGRPSV